MKTFSIILSLAASSLLMGQTAANWSVNDCSGNSHNLFEDLDAGKAAVIVWVMPCDNCINPALWVQTEVENALSSYPGKVVYYLADDNGNTNCSVLADWANTNGITKALALSDKNVSMAPYGAAGMPKIVIVGGSEHKVFYNENAPNITSLAIKGALAAALASPSGINEKQKDNFSFSVFPNPSNSSTAVSINVVSTSKVSIEIYDEFGRQVQEVFKGTLNPGPHDYNLNTSDLANGLYYVNFSNSKKTVQERLLVSH
jgi:hypothetical protein